MNLHPAAKLMAVSAVLAILALISADILYAAQSTITEAQGYACMGVDKSRKQTEQEAMADAKRNAAEKALTYIKSDTHVKDFQIEKDIIDAYSNASIQIIHEVENGWYKDVSAGDCYRTKIKAEVTPDEKAMGRIGQDKNVTDDPSAPLSIHVWTDKKSYKQGEKIKTYLRGNKPFYAKVIYKDASGEMIQLIPNPYRVDNYFNGGVVYELPAGNDRFDLEVTPPFGQEDIIVYASTSPLGDINLEAQGEIYRVKTDPKDIGIRTRGVTVKQKGDSKRSDASEFFEEKTVVNTAR